jgi:cobalt-zinc-cadmium efflux system membrane fusion protein
MTRYPAVAARAARRQPGFFLGLGVIVALALPACSQSKDDAAAASSSQALLFTVPANQRGHLKVVAVKKKPVTLPVTVPALVNFNELKTSRVVPLVSGKVAKIKVHEGDHVKSGQVLLTIASPDSSDMAANIARDRSALATKKVILARDKDLYEHKAISLEELQQAELDVKAAEATVANDNSQAAITGGAGSQAVLRSPISGTVVARNIAVGEAVSAGSTACFTITDPTAAWVIAQLYQQDLRDVQLGDSAVIRSPVLKKPIDGKVTYIGASIDANTLTVPVRIAADNEDGLLKQGMYVDAEIIPARSITAMVVPDAAVLRDEDNLPFVYVEVSAGKFARRHVKLGAEIDDETVVESGLKDGDKVLADGALFVQFADSLER